MKKNFILLLISVVLLAACAPTPFPVADPDVSQNGIEIYQARIPVPAGLATPDSMNMDNMDNMDMQMDFNLAAFMVIKNTSATDDRLLSASVDFADASIHETRSEGDVMKMVEVEGIDIPAGQTVELRSGSFHIMLMNPMMAPKVGDTVNLTLEFEKAGTVIVPAKAVEQ